MDRRIPQDIETYSFDLIVVGAGINGAGIARDAAMRGLKVLLLDKGDVASGTTSWSTRLIHGGLRYLEYYELYLVHESLSERETLLKIAPHLVKPLPFIIPVYDYSKRGTVLVRLGMIGYDTLSWSKSLDRHKMLSREEVIERIPGLEAEGLLGAAMYYDGQVEYAERLAVENAVSAREHGAVVLTYAGVDRLVVEDGDVVGVEFTDLLGGGEYTVRAPVTANVAGPWVDEVLRRMDFAEERMIGGTKGSHLVVDPFPGAPAGEALYAEAKQDGRPYFIVPWNGRYLIGTTDIRYEGDLDEVVASEEEIDYLINETNTVIPSANLTRDKVLFTYSGIRPLPYETEGAEGSVTRGHLVYDHATHDPRIGGLISIIGGKLTTYRNLARQTVNEVYEKLGRKTPECHTDLISLPGGAAANFDEFAANFKLASGLTEELAVRLLRLYGTRAPDVLAEAGEDHSLRVPLGPSPTPETGIIGAEVLFAFRRELAEKLGDVLLRRSMVGMGPKVGLDVDKAAARVAVKHLGWSQERADREVKEFRDYVRRYKPRDLREGELTKV
ncbi:MAG TPA: glycerol-3-phosphate dehydrogenase [Rubrobacteraceae bacterium]|nr:glycerol-3-phosphate dehydrogenase [Rubrobacteraceae bacterium]